MITSILTGFLLLLMGCNTVPKEIGPSSRNYSWNQTDKSLALVNEEKIVWQFNYERQLKSKPFFHPLCLVDGTQLTWRVNPPQHHTWHYGLWFTWKYINGETYWETDDRWSGQTELLDIKIKKNTDHSAKIKIKLSYHPPEKDEVLAEKRILYVSSPDKEGLYYIDWYSKFTAGDKEVVLTTHGGYAGLTVRISEDTGGWEVVNSQGQKGMDAHGKSGRWMDFSVADKKSGKTGGITIMDHPENLNHEPRWFVITDHYGFFEPAPLFNEPYTIASGQSLVLKYRIMIHPGRADIDPIEGQWKQYIKLKS